MGVSVASPVLLVSVTSLRFRAPLKSCSRLRAWFKRDLASGFRFVNQDPSIAMKGRISGDDGVI